ncbi:MAG: hypothetical protein ACRD4R_17530 [Candidatus Acidiferrales bacterium]
MKQRFAALRCALCAAFLLFVIISVMASNCHKRQLTVRISGGGQGVN